MDSEAEVLKAISRVEDKLTSLINSGLAAVNQAIVALTALHHSALLEQERRNSTFADRQRVEALAGKQHELLNSVIAHTELLRDLQACDKELEAKIEELRRLTLDGDRHASDRSFSLLTTGTGYAVAFLCLVLGAILSFTLAHLVH